MNIREQALAALGGPSRENFLNALAGGLAMSGRGEYVEAGNDEAHALTALRTHNEMMITVTTQMITSRAGSPAYRDEAFLRALSERAAIGHVGHVLRRALLAGLSGSTSRVRS
jgi:hypothetical protein